MGENWSPVSNFPSKISFFFPDVAKETGYWSQLSASGGAQTQTGITLNGFLSKHTFKAKTRRINKASV